MIVHKLIAHQGSASSVLGSRRATSQPELPPQQASRSAGARMTVADNPKVKAAFGTAAMIVVGAFTVGVGVGAAIAILVPVFAS